VECLRERRHQRGERPGADACFPPRDTFEQQGRYEQQATTGPADSLAVMFQTPTSDASKP